MKTINRQNIKLLGAVLFVLFAMTSCEDFLEEDPLTQVDISNFYQSESDALAGLTGAYAQLKNDNGYFKK